MADPQDTIELSGIPVRRGGEPQAAGPLSKWKMIWFQCCHVYGRMYRNASATMYIGRCPRCGARVQARIGPGGTSQNMFTAR